MHADLVALLRLARAIDCECDFGRDFVGRGGGGEGEEEGEDEGEDEGEAHGGGCSCRFGRIGGVGWVECFGRILYGGWRFDVKGLGSGDGD